MRAALVALGLAALCPAPAAAAEAPTLDAQVIAARTGPKNEVALVLMVTGDGLDPSALPADAELIVQLLDVSLADAPPTVVAEQRIAPVRVPAAFTLTYDPAQIDQRHSYAVSARVERGGKQLFVTDTRHPVLTQGGGSTVDIVMTRVRSP